MITSSGRFQLENKAAFGCAISFLKIDILLVSVFAIAIHFWHRTQIKSNHVLT